MAVNESRNMNDNLAAGLTDGVVKKIAPDWGGDDRDVYAVQKRNETLPSYYDAVTWGQSSAVEKVAERQTKLFEKDPPMDWDTPISPTVDRPLVP